MKQGDRSGDLLNRETGERVAVNDPLRRVKRLRKRLSRWGQTIAEPMIRDGRAVMLMVTLTYRPGEDPKPGDRKIFMRKIRRKLGEKLIAYSNVAELQEDRRMAHFHYLLLIRRGAWLPTPDKGHLWTHGSTNVKRNVRTVGYLLKYVSKADAGEFELPKNMRAYDVRVRAVAEFSAAQIIDLRLSSIPRWLEEQVFEWCIETERMPERMPGGGWKLSGKEYFSPWEYIGGKPEGLRPSLIHLGQTGKATVTAAATR
jgi:hypothetical protein